MRIFDVLLGRTRPVEANLDSLFGLPGAVVTLDVSEALEPSGQGGVCYKPAAGQPFAKTTEEFEQLLGLSTSASVKESSDQYGYHWVVIDDADFQSLVNEVHVVNTTLQDQGYGPQLLCSVFGFRPKGTALRATASVYLVYLFKRGAFYPFVPLAGSERRDLESEMRLQNVLAEDLAIEKDKERWMPLWGLPVH
ncbi:MAG: hypothetical protein M0Z69_05005 [Actinomycetota bacterium]|nr:hypothetical protein [Actinomycetota bacterium]